MSYRIFEIETRPTLTNESIHRAEVLKKEICRFVEIGTNNRSQSLRMEFVGVTRGGLIVTPSLTPEESTIWHEWLTMSWSACDLNWSICDFSSMPDIVIEHLAKCKRQEGFVEYQVRGRCQADEYVLVGINGSVEHLLARWNKRGHRLMTFDDIKREMKRRWPSENRFYFFFDEIACVLACLDSVLAGVYGRWIIGDTTSITWVLMPIVGVVVFVLLRRRLYAREWAKSEIGQAIVRHDLAHHYPENDSTVSAI